MQDLECKEKMDSMTSQCINQLKLVPEKHGESISNIRSKAERCLTKDYQVNFVQCDRHIPSLFFLSFPYRA